MEDVLDVYSRTYDPDNPVVCFDGSPKQLVSELRRPYIGKDGVKYEDCEYKREGASELMMVVEPLGGRRDVLVRDSHDGLTWARAMMYPGAGKVTVVMDNLSSHKVHNLYKIFPPERASEIRDRWRSYIEVI